MRPSVTGATRGVMHPATPFKCANQMQDPPVKSAQRINSWRFTKGCKKFHGNSSLSATGSSGNSTSTGGLVGLRSVTGPIMIVMPVTLLNSVPSPCTKITTLLVNLSNSRSERDNMISPGEDYHRRLKKRASGYSHLTDDAATIWSALSALHNVDVPPP
jgi:hypothetical protein